MDKAFIGFESACLKTENLLPSFLKTWIRTPTLKVCREAYSPGKRSRLEQIRQIRTARSWRKTDTSQVCHLL